MNRPSGSQNVRLEAMLCEECGDPAERAICEGNDVLQALCEACFQEAVPDAEY